MNEQILNTSNEAAKFVTDLKGWIDRHGRFWGEDKRMAQWSGCTHILCPECGKPTVKIYTICEECREKKVIERYNKKEQKKWDGEIPLYSETVNEYFMDWDELNDFLENPEGGCTVESLRLVICEPVYLRQIDEDYFCDELPDEGELPPDIANALNEMNLIISKQGPVSWEPGKYRI